jgi:hypothetical protein
MARALVFGGHSRHDAAVTLSAARSLRSGVDAALAAPRLVLPLWLAAVAASLVGVVPMAWLGLEALVRARRWGLPLSEGGFWLALGDAAGRPSSWGVVMGGLLLAKAGGWLVEAVARAGVTTVLARQVGRPAGAPLPAWGAGVLEAPERWLTAAGLSLALAGGTLVAAVGLVGSALAVFATRPGVGSSALMAFAVMTLAVPVVAEAALALGVARSTLVDEAPFDSLAGGLRALFARPASLLGPWLVLALGDLAVGGLATILGAGLPGVGDVPERLVWATVAHGAVMVVAALGHAAVALVRQGTLAAMVEHAEGRLPEPPPPVPPEPVREPVYEAVALRLVVDRDADEPGV